MPEAAPNNQQSISYFAPNVWAEMMKIHHNALVATGHRIPGWLSIRPLLWNITDTLPLDQWVDPLHPTEGNEQ